MKIVKKAYKFRIYPTLEQVIFFLKNFGCVRKVHNLMLDDRKKDYEEYKSTGIKTKYPTPAKYKEEYPYLKEVDSLALANAQLNLEKAFKNFLKNKDFGFPKYKCKSNPVQSYTTNNQNTIYIKDSYIKLPKLKSLVKIKLHRKIKGIIKSATISKNSLEHYFVSILCEEEIEEFAKTNKNIGIDLGIKEFATMSDCTKVENLKLTKEYEKKLKREQRKLSRRCKLAKDSAKKLSDSKNYQKQKKKVAKIHNKIRNKRKDFVNKLSTKIINNHDIICIEDLNIKGMLKNHKLAKSISDVSWSEFVRQLEYKANWYGKKIIKIPTFYPSSKTCSSCGNIKETLTLSERIYHCECCGLEIDRDYNASINILRKGLEILKEEKVS
ncbi:IS200/IS605 family element RNA-guided endonuclease TnpB [Fusobacterium pseudoperiodonticum]|uniref:IS200/IS605 family element RNA-guided endonuclease TnpB n=1 Tax=Fusobacterium pseudoperiodonticum TaxID=2663009 RepID=UPI000C1B4F12|nr:IS200/IS605 family element RNA-guided endonuclease TnpB [Fusobacterium pseudoperiodonticum]ATV57767.1 transposase [Fusobacterium pseudoperiodonticum]ATV63425.1 transposase [Fusobacterium pseudoperiodonticum]PIM77442.1 transposase [Fusobacterium pseudoperiodonticum]